MKEKELKPIIEPPSEEAIKKLLPWLVAVAFFMELLDTTILNTAVPVLADAMKVPPLSMKAVLSSYTLSLAVFIPVSGWMADRFGTRKIFASAIGLFTLGSFLCGVSSNIHVMVACRILQGCGGAMMMPVGRLTLVRTFAKSELMKAMTFVAIPGLVGPMLGPTIGGLIVEYFHWRWIFFVNIPIGILGLYLVLRLLPDYKARQSRPLDFWGLVLFGTGISLLSYVLEVFGEHQLSASNLWLLFITSLVLLGGYGMRAAHALNPLLDLTIFRIRTFRTAVGGGFLTRVSMGGIPFLFPLLYQVGLGFTPMQSGLLMMPQAFAAMSLKLLLPRILKHFGYRSVLVGNTFVLGIWSLCFATITSHTSIILILIQSFGYGFLASLQYTSMNTLVYADIPEGGSSQASTISSTMQQMSMSFGVASASLLAAFFIPDRFNATSSEMIYGVHRAFFCMGLLTAVTTVAFFSLQ
ncbi:MAG: DHA2 family efflux MFS transporter permease subunit, partial [Verrucomicrobiota bacterium]